MLAFVFYQFSNMIELDETEFDLVVLGTGLIDSIIAAAAAKAGRSVLQLDEGGVYGGEWASVHLDELLPQVQRAPSCDCADPAGGLPPPLLQQARVMIRPGADLGPPRAYSIDLAPKALYGVGPMIALLLGSGAHHHTEFKLVQGSYLYRDGQLQAVPSSRAEVFRDRSLSPLQKRTLMRFLKACTEAAEGQGPLGASFDGRPFGELMREQGLDQQLQCFLAHGVLLQQQGADSLPSDQALQLLKMYIESAGRYGPDAGPLLTPMYGCGELSQAFCRVAAVAGAIQVLRCPIAGLAFDEQAERCIGVELGSGQVVRCRQLAGGAAPLREAIRTYCPPMHRTQVHRCAAILDAPVRAGEQQTLVAFPPGSLPAGPQSSTVWALCVGHSTAVCPPGRWLLHLWAEGDGASSAHDALWPALLAVAQCGGLIARLTASEADAEPANGVADASEAGSDSVQNSAEGEAQRPAVLLAAFFTTQCMTLAGPLADWPGNVALCPGPGPEVTLAQAVGDAKRCYWQLYPPAPEDDSSQRFPLDPDPTDAAQAGGESDEEALEALQAALGPADEQAAAEAAADGPAVAGG